MSKRSKQRRLEARKDKREQERAQRSAEADRVADKWSGQDAEAERVEAAAKLARSRKGILG